MCFGSTQAVKAADKPAAALSFDDYTNAAVTTDGEGLNARINKKGKRTAEAFVVLGKLIRARRIGQGNRIREILDEYVTSLR